LNLLLRSGKAFTVPRRSTRRAPSPCHEILPEHDASEDGKAGTAEPAASRRIGDTGENGKFLGVERLIQSALLQDNFKGDALELPILEHPGFMRRLLVHGFERLRLCRREDFQNAQSRPACKSEQEIRAGEKEFAPRQDGSLASAEEWRISQGSSAVIDCQTSALSACGYDYLWKHFVLGMGYGEIAEERELTYDSVRMKIGRCLEAAQSLVG
jgi:hypothetical protein